eukprot:scaffold8106_cov107-Isochrysis_galbana.AAC.8
MHPARGARHVPQPRCQRWALLQLARPIAGRCPPVKSSSLATCMRPPEPRRAQHESSRPAGTLAPRNALRPRV